MFKGWEVRLDNSLRRTVAVHPVSWQEPGGGGDNLPHGTRDATPLTALLAVGQDVVVCP